MNSAKRAFLYSLRYPIMAYRRLFLDLHVWGRENIPQGPKIYVTNHVTSTDPFWVLPEFTEAVHIVIGPGYKLPIFAKVLDAFEQINCMPAHRKTVVEKAVGYLRKGEAVYMAPEGDLQELFELGRFYPGVARMYRHVQVPMVPIALVAPKHAMREYPRFNDVVEGRVYRMVPVLRGTYCINIGAPLQPKLPDDNPEVQEEFVSTLLKDRMRELIHDVRMDKFWLSPI